MAQVPLVNFAIDRTAALGLQKQIQVCTVRGILSGRMPPRARMPSTRQLAEFLGISRITVSLAYSDLLSNGFIEAQARSGFYISSVIPEAAGEYTRQEVLEERSVYTPNFARRYTRHRASPYRPENWREYPYRFIYGQADASILDHHRWRQCSLEALGKRNFDHLSLDSYEHDDPMLVEYLLNMTLPERGIYAKPDEILITMGAQNALWLCARLFLDKDKVAVAENPCYPALLSMLLNRKCKLQSVDVDAEGLDSTRLPGKVDVVFTTPNHHCPTNATMPRKRREALLALAAQRDFVIIEDDYEVVNEHIHQSKPALKALDRDGHVIFVGSFSKALFPSLRLGFMVASPEIICEARALRGLMLRHPPSHIQRTVAYFQSLGYFDSQKKRTAAAYNRRREILLAAIRAHGLEFASPPEAGGSSFWMKTAPDINTTALAEELRGRGVLIEPGETFFHPQMTARNYYRLAYSAIEPDNIEPGVALIREAIEAWSRP